jgi:hypothetical protein
MNSKGISASIKPETIPIVLGRAALIAPNKPALKVQRNNKEYMWTWGEYL